MKILVCSLCLAACGGANEATSPQEVIEKLRALGVKADVPVVEIPAADSPPTYASFTAYAATPYDASVQMAPWLPTVQGSSSVAAALADIVIGTPQMTKQQIGKLFIHSATFKVRIPATKSWDKTPDKAGRLMFGVELTQGAEVQQMEAAVLAYPAGSTQLTWKTPTLTLSSPTAGATFKNNVANDLIATDASAQSENMMIGWYVSSGSIKNRQQASTSWYPGAVGDGTVIATVRGRSSLGFDIQIIPVKVE